MNFNCEVELSQKDYIRFCQYNSFRLKITCAFYFIAIFLYFNFRYEFIDNIIMATIFTTVFSLILHILQLIQAKAMYKTNKLFRNKVSICIDKDGVREHSEDLELEIAYKNIHKIRESKYGVYICTGKNVAVIIPKHILSASDYKKLYGLLNENTDPQKIKLKRVIETD